MSFEEYLISKKIDQRAFEMAEAKLFKEWKFEFEQMHPNSFTVQKLNLINPIRRKYTLKVAPVGQKIEEQVEVGHVVESIQTDQLPNIPSTTEPSEVKPQPAKPARPVFKPKMK